jgi:two-component system, NarL family, response regulator NreC
MNNVRVLVADDHEIVLEGVRALLAREPGLEVCGVASNGRDAIASATKMKPDVVVLDMTLPDLDGLSAIRQIKRALPKTEIVVYSAHSSEEVIEDVFDAGAKSYIGKADASRDLIDAIRSVAEHKQFLTPEVSQILFGKFLGAEAPKKKGPAEQKLTPREREVVRLLAQSSSNKEIAAALGISVRTAETHRATLMRKLGINSLAGLVRYAIRNNIIEA